jgi:hypothetical protein
MILNSTRLYRYYLVNRPPHIGTHPRGGEVARDVWMPGKRIEEQPEDHDRRALGWVEYDRQLTVEEIRQYELFPADERERAASGLWQEW